MTASSRIAVARSSSSAASSSFAWRRSCHVNFGLSGSSLIPAALIATARPWRTIVRCFIGPPSSPRNARHTRACADTQRSAPAPAGALRGGAPEIDYFGLLDHDGAAGERKRGTSGVDSFGSGVSSALGKGARNVVDTYAVRTVITCSQRGSATGRGPLLQSG